MWRFPLPALAVVVLAAAAAGCDHGGGHPAATATTKAQRSSAPCRLDRAQRRAVGLAFVDIRHLRRINARMHAFSQHGAPKEEELTGKFLLDAGSVNLPLNVFSRLLNLAKVATSLCGDCFQGLEADAPFLGNRGQNRCG